MKFTRDVPPHLRIELQAEQFRLFRKQFPTLYAALFINTGILCFSVYGAVPIGLSLFAPVAIALLLTVGVLILIARRGKVPSAIHIAKHLLSCTIVASIFSLGMGIWAAALLRSDLGNQQFVPLYVVFGAISSTYCLGSLPRAAFATVILAAAPVIVMLLTSGTRIGVAEGVSLLVIFILVLRLVVNQYVHLIESVSSHSQVRALAYTDPLTGLPNRRAFIECLESAVCDSPKGGMRAAVAMIDLDGFKAINDTFGHAAGDAVLVQAAGRIQAAFTSCRMVARLGGDEFAALMVGDYDRAAFAGIGKLLVREMRMPFAVSGSQLRLSASIGVAGSNKGDVSAPEVMSRADVALYEVKQGGGNGLLLFESTMALRLRRRMTLEQALRETDPPPRIEVLYQPIFDARTRQITSFEALSRWDHPELGPIPPSEFIGVAEQTGTIAVLSEQIFDAAIREAADWAAPIGLAINLSALDLSRPITTFTILSLCNRYGFDPKRLEVEVTETSVLSDFDAARDQINLLQKYGIRVALDDFGSGFASISYLKEITFDRVKIDGELIDDLLESPKARHLLQGILQLCSAIGLPTTAEKVESEYQLAVLTGLGCDRLQGFLLGCPVNASAAREFAVVRARELAVVRLRAA